MLTWENVQLQLLAHTPVFLVTWGDFEVLTSHHC